MKEHHETTHSCLVCGCAHPLGAGAHAIVAALADDDLDQAMTLGLLEQVPCVACTTACTLQLQRARDARLRALAARDRYRARNARLQRRAAERMARRAAIPATDTHAPALPPAAAAALARAKAKAIGKT
jgi:hypothetical protein